MTIDVKEHVYDDDPKKGHPDVQTFLPGVSYFFLGNGKIQAAVQFAPFSKATPLGLLIMNPEHLGKKRESFTMDSEYGIEKTMIRLHCREKLFSAAKPCHPSAKWFHDLGMPAVLARWRSGQFQVREVFYCPDLTRARLRREVSIQNLSPKSTRGRLKTGIGRKTLEKEFSLAGRKTLKICIKYTLQGQDNSADLSFENERPPLPKAQQHWQKAGQLSFQSQLLDHYFKSCSRQLPAVISKTGKVDAGIWQYNREWVRDHSFMAAGLTLAGYHELAGTMLSRLLDEFVSEEGDCIDSSERRDPEDVELDQNGTLLYALKNYVLWSGDDKIVFKNWGKIRKAANFPLRDVFRHQPSGMFFNCRDYWERHQAHGIEPGIELMYQVFPAIGLSAAAYLARLISKEEEANLWEKEAQKLKQAILNHPEYALVDRRGLVKRRDINGAVQEAISPRKGSGLPDGVPLARNIIHYLQPDSSAALPIALGFIPAQHPAARATLEQLELLWNQGWTGGGYGRYNLTSEADSAGPWPLSSLIIARAYLETADFAKVWRVLKWLNTIPGALSGSWFEMYGPRIAPPYAQIGILPWTWAEMLMLLIQHILGLQVQEDGIRFRPRLLPGMGNVRGSLPIRGRRIMLDIKQRLGIGSPSFQCSSKLLESSPQQLLIPYVDDDISLEATLP
jgi:hypothetical protein